MASSSGRLECVTIVMLEMGLSFFGIVLNLLVVATLRQEEYIRGSTNNFLLFNLCFSNLVIAFLVKPMSAIYIGYAISSESWEVGLTFCSLYTIIYHATWCVFPFTLVSMCWIKLLSQCRCPLCGILCCTEGGSPQRRHLAKQEENIPVISFSSSSSTYLSPHIVVVTDSENHSSPRGKKKKKNGSRTLEDGPTVKQKGIISGIWILAFIFGSLFVFQDKILGSEPKNSESKTFCKIRTGVNDVFDYISLLIAFGLPLLIGPLLIGIAQIVFIFVGRFICKSCSGENQDELSKQETKGPSWFLIGSFSLVFLLTYPIHMFISETYFTGDYFTFLIVKYTLGFLFILLIPLLTIQIERDIRRGMERLFNGSILCGSHHDGIHSNSEEIHSGSID